MDSDEKILIQRLAEGDQMAFELLFYRYRGRLHNFIRSALPPGADVEGLVLEVFLRVWIGRERIDPERPFAPWAFRIARNLVIDYLRSDVGKLLYLTDDLFVADTHSDTSTSVEERQLTEWFGTNLDKLPEQRRKIFTMSRIEGMSYKEIAEQLGITENSVDTQIRRALLFFRRELDKIKIFLFF
jgi:RNA polymerase sigma-70 factor (ECF subfamily)